MMQNEPVGIALNCNVDGRIANVVLDKLGISDDKPQAKQTIFDYVDAGSIEKTRLFLEEVINNRACFDWEINFKVGGGVETLHLAGAIVDDKLLVVGTRDSQNLMPLFEEIMRIYNQQVNAFRSLYKEQLDLASQKTERDQELFDDLSQLNNELIQLQRELAKKNEALARLNEQKNQFLGMAAHDLRNPLSAITAYSGLLLGETQDVLDNEQLEFLSIIQSSSDFMLRLINDLLDVSKIEAGKLNLEIIPVNLEELIKRNVAINQALAARKEISLQLKFNDPASSVWIDPSKMEQVLNNLIGNAIKYSPKGSNVMIDVYSEDENLIIRVKDEGPGIPLAEQANLFKAFSRTSVRPTGGEQSTGLGLLIAKRIVEGHQGEIWVESDGKSGTAFFVSLLLQNYLDTE